MATVEERLFTHEQQIQAQLVQYNTNSYWEKQEAEKEMWKALYYKQQVYENIANLFRLNLRLKIKLSHLSQDLL